MMIILLTVPACILSIFLAVLCYRRSFYRHSVVLSLFAAFMLIVTLGVLGVGYAVWIALEAEIASS